jgi:hypothetical protein
MLYTAYNLTIRSELPLPELIPSSEEDVIDAHIRYGPVPHNGIAGGKQLGPFLWTTDHALWLKVPEVATFYVLNGNEIIVDPAPGIDEDSIRVFLLGSAFGALLFQRGYLVMHGNAIRIGDQCMICVGHSGSGKSTLATGFMQRGYSVLADDVVPVDDDCFAVPGFPRIKLWQDVATQLDIDTKELQRIRPELEKFNLPLLTHQFGNESIPVRWVYILSTEENQDEIIFEPIQGMERFMPLRNNTYRVRYLDGMALKHDHLKLCGKLASNVRVARVTRPRRGFQLDKLINHLLADMAKNP